MKPKSFYLTVGMIALLTALIPSVSSGGNPRQDFSKKYEGEMLFRWSRDSAHYRIVLDELKKGDQWTLTVHLYCSETADLPFEIIICDNDRDYNWDKISIRSLPESDLGTVERQNGQAVWTPAYKTFTVSYEQIEIARDAFDRARNTVYNRDHLTYSDGEPYNTYTAGVLSGGDEPQVQFSNVYKGLIHQNGRKTTPQRVFIIAADYRVTIEESKRAGEWTRTVTLFRNEVADAPLAIMGYDNNRDGKWEKISMRMVPNDEWSTVELQNWVWGSMTESANMFGSFTNEQIRFAVEGLNKSMDEVYNSSHVVESFGKPEETTEPYKPPEQQRDMITVYKAPEQQPQTVTPPPNKSPEQKPQGTTQPRSSRSTQRNGGEGGSGIEIGFILYLLILASLVFGIFTFIFRKMGAAGHKDTISPSHCSGCGGRLSSRTVGGYGTHSTGPYTVEYCPVCEKREQKDRVEEKARLHNEADRALPHRCQECGRGTYGGDFCVYCGGKIH